MAFELNEVVPWGRSFAEYEAMFSLAEGDLNMRILGCGDGPAGFNAEQSRRGGSVVSVDPLYAFDRDEIARRVEDTFDTVLEQTRKNAHEFVWDHIGSVEELGEVRMAAMRKFLDDYPEGRGAGRYLAGALPELPFADDAFDLGLCSHFLFLYSQHHDLSFHFESMLELCRVCREVRVFPLLQLGGTPSPHLEPVVEKLTGAGYAVDVVPVAYEFQRGGNRMLKVGREGRVGPSARDSG